MGISTRTATKYDATAIARIHNEGIADRVATFETEPCTTADGVAEFSVYVARGARRQGAGRLVMAALLEHVEAAGAWKLVSRVFPENMASRALLRTMDFREVGIYEKHARLDGAWRDVVIVERLLPGNLT